MATTYLNNCARLCANHIICTSVRFTTYQATIDPVGNRITTVYDSIDRVQATIDALGNRTTLAYDGVGNLLARIDARGNATCPQPNSDRISCQIKGGSSDKCVLCQVDRVDA